MSVEASAPTETRLPTLDGTLLELDPGEEAFFKSETGIQDTEELREHILKIQADAYKVYPYPCIRWFGFAKLKITRIPAYARVLDLAKSRPGSIFLDIGCCMGVQARKIICDGWPMSHTIATDLEPGFWDLGHKLFRTTPEAYPAKFLAGDAFDDAHLSLTAPLPPGPPPLVAIVNTLTELRGHISVILACSLFHLFDEEKQLELGKRLAALLDLRPGSIILGSNCAVPVKGQRHGVFPRMFCHSPESWTQMWEEQIFDKGRVKVNTTFRELELSAHWSKKVFLVEEEGPKFGFLFWSVERL